MTNKYDDLPLPTRHGPPTGDANERTMAAHVDRAGIQKTYRRNPDGSMTRLSTRLGHNEYVTDAPEGQKQALELYLESGAQTVLDDSENTSVWEMLDLIPPKDFMGWVVAEGANIGTHSRGALNTGNASKAMIEPERKPVAKKIPASLFSGSMRLFIQAQYGAKGRTELYTEDGTPFSYGTILTIGGYSMGAYSDHIRSVYKNDGDMADASNIELYYLDSANENTSLQLGFSVSMSCGIYRSEKKYWVITIARSGASYAIKAYPLKFSAAAYHMRAKVHRLLKSGEPTADERKTARQCMAYAFAYAKIDTANVVNLGSFAGPEGYPLAYGWKWNSDGTEARIVTHKTTIASAGSYFEAFGGKLTIAYTDNPYLIDEKDKFLVTLDIEEYGYWEDHQSSKIYRPLSETVDLAADNPYRLHATTVDITGFPAAGFGYCEDTPIYGFYVNDEWTPLLYTNFVGPEDYNRTLIQKADNVWTKDDSRFPDLNPGVFNGSFVVEGGFIGDFPGISGHIAGQSFFYDRKIIPKWGTNLKFSFGNSEAVTGIPNDISRRWTESVTFVDAGIEEPPASAMKEFDASQYFAAGSGSSGWIIYNFQQSEVDAAAQAAIDGFANEYATWPEGQDRAPVAWYIYKVDGKGDCVGQYDYYERPAGVGDPIATVIPPGDAEAIFIASGDDRGLWTKKEYSIPEDPLYHRNYSYCRYLLVKQYYCLPPHAHAYEYQYIWEEVIGQIHPIIQRFDMLPAANGPYSCDIPQTGEETENKYINGKVDETVCPVEPDYEAFWNPSHLFFEAGMFSLSGMGNKFITSEGADSGDVLEYADRFCGWV